ncbi:MAG: CNP1-like family protein [Pseudomonadota bacterium]
MKTIVFFILFFFYPSLFASDIFDKLGADTEANYTGDFEEIKWQEELTAIPALPDKDDLIVFSGVAAYPQYQYAIDEKTLSVGKKDNLVRFIVVISSSSGTANSYYQGLSCSEKRIKTYAYAHSTSDKFVVYGSPVWQNLSGTGAMGYSKGLAEFYFCAFLGGALNKAEIINNLKYEKDESGLHYD